MNPSFANRLGVGAGTDPEQERLRRLEAQLRAMGRGMAPDATRVDPDPSGGSDPLLSVLRFGAEMAPVSGELLSAADAKQQFGEGNYGMAALSGLGALPGIGMMGRVAKRGAKAALPRLSALHNITEQKLARSLDLGGMPVPSIAVVPEQVPFTDFGPITLIGKQSLGDPATSRVYSADAYTTRVPNRTWPKLTKQQADEFWKETTGSFGNRFDDYAFRALQDNDLDRAIFQAHMSPDIVANFARDVRKLAPVDVERIRKGGIENYGILGPLGEDFNRYAQDVFAPLRQNPQVKVGRELRDWDLDNVAEAMSRKGRLTEGGFGDAPTSGEIRAAHANIFRGLEPMRQAAATDVRVDEEAYLGATGDLLREVRNLAYEIASSGPPTNRSPSGGFRLRNPFENKLGVVNDKIHRALGSKGDLERNLAREGLKDVPPNALESLAKALDNFKRAPVKYFEAKPQRGVRFDEFAGAVVPENTDASLIERLRNAGLQVEPYKSIVGSWDNLQMNPRARLTAVERLRRLLNEQGGNTLFSLGALGTGLGAATPSRSRQDNR